MSRDAELDKYLEESYGGSITPPSGGDDDVGDYPPVQGYMPDLNPTQEKVFRCQANFILAHGEKGSGKSVGNGHKIVSHCYENRNALVLLISPSLRAGNEGLWFDLQTMILPAWSNDMGLQWLAKVDPVTKDREIWIRNRHGDMSSKILLMSIPHASQIPGRVKGPAPSMVCAEELTDCASSDYFTYPAAQLERRRDIVGRQQFVASCNPAGPNHWVYKTFFEDPVDSDTGVTDPDYAVFHVPISENLHRLPDSYIKNLRKIFRDPIMKRRLIDGEWIDAPTGDSIFAGYYDEGVHVYGDAAKREGLTPVPGFPIYIGYDPGPINFAVEFLQPVMLKDRVIWMVFDELNYVGNWTPYKRVVRDVMARMDFWSDYASEKFSFLHVSDDAAFSHRRADGSFDSLEIQRESNGRIKLFGCPKGAGSVVGRVKMLRDMLLSESIFFSAMVKKTRDCMNGLRSERKKGEWDATAAMKPRPSPHKHPFDALTYPMFRDLSSHRPAAASGKRVKSGVILCGQG